MVDLLLGQRRVNVWAIINAFIVSKQPGKHKTLTNAGFMLANHLRR